MPAGKGREGEKEEKDMDTINHRYGRSLCQPLLQPPPLFRSASKSEKLSHFQGHKK